MVLFSSHVAYYPHVRIIYLNLSKGRDIYDLSQCLMELQGGIWALPGTKIFIDLMRILWGWFLLLSNKMISEWFSKCHEMEWPFLKLSSNRYSRLTCFYISQEDVSLAEVPDIKIFRNCDKNSVLESLKINFQDLFFFCSFLLIFKFLSLMRLSCPVWLSAVSHIGLSSFMPVASLL